MQVIIHKNLDGSIGVTRPTEDVLRYATIEQIAKKDVPAGLEYVIVDESDVPTDRTFRMAWEWGYDYFDGVGGASNEFTKTVLDKIKAGERHDNGKHR